MASQELNERGLSDVTVIIDVGTGYMRGGLAGEDNPRRVLPTAMTSPQEVTPCFLVFVFIHVVWLLFGYCYCCC